MLGGALCYYEEGVPADLGKCVVVIISRPSNLPADSIKLFNGMKPRLTQILFKFFSNLFNHKKLKVFEQSSFQQICWGSR